MIPSNQRSFVAHAEVAQFDDGRRNSGKGNCRVACGSNRCPGRRQQIPYCATDIDLLTRPDHESHQSPSSGVIHETNRTPPATSLPFAGSRTQPNGRGEVCCCADRSSGSASCFRHRRAATFQRGGDPRRIDIRRTPCRGQRRGEWPHRHFDGTGIGDPGSGFSSSFTDADVVLAADVTGDNAVEVIKVTGFANDGAGLASVLRCAHRSTGQWHVVRHAVRVR